MRKLVDYLKTIANKDAWSDDLDFSPFDNSGGNYDDAYYGGCDDGEIYLARQILGKFFSGEIDVKEQDSQNSS